MALFDQFGNPVSTARMTARASRGSLSGWRGPQVLSREGESRERGVMQRRAADLAANDWAAHSAVEAVSGNAIGTGLVPMASIPADMLGIPPESARELGKRMEWAFALWTSEADVRGQCHFADLQNLGVRTMLGMGEMLHLAVMLGGGGVRTAGARAGYGRPEGYYLATPKPSPASAYLPVERSALLEADFTYVPARVGHRPNVFYLFRHETDEQVRGFSAFFKGIELFRILLSPLPFYLLGKLYFIKALTAKNILIFIVGSLIASSMFFYIFGGGLYFYNYPSYIHVVCLLFLFFDLVLFAINP